MNYDSWKANEPDPYADEPPRDEHDAPDEAEPARLMKGACYDLSTLRLRGWWTPVGYKHHMEGYTSAEYFDGGRYLGPDSFGVEPLFEQIVESL